METMAGALGESEFGRAVLQTAISSSSFAISIKGVEKVMNLASWKLPDLDSDVFNIYHGKNRAYGGRVRKTSTLG